MNPVTAAVATGVAAGIGADVALSELPNVAPNLGEHLGHDDATNRDLHSVLVTIEAHLHAIRLMNEKTQISDSREVHTLTKTVQETIADRGYAHFVIFCPAVLTVTFVVDGLSWSASLAAGPNLVDVPGNSYVTIQSGDSNTTMNVLFIWTNREFGNPV